MEENIVNPNAEGQEQAPVAQGTPATDAATATTNAPAATATTDVAEAPVEATTQAAPQSEPVVAQAPVEERLADTAHDDFDWSIDKRNVATYSQEEKVKYDKVYENTFVQLNDGELITGTVVGITKTDVVLNIGFKSDGLISLNEFRDLQNMKVGDEVEVMVIEKEDRAGNLNQSRKQARNNRAWERIVQTHKTDEIVTGTVTYKIKCCCSVDVCLIQTFLPASQSDVKPVNDHYEFVV